MACRPWQAAGVANVVFLPDKLPASKTDLEASEAACGPGDAVIEYSGPDA